MKMIVKIYIVICEKIRVIMMSRIKRFIDFDDNSADIITALSIFFNNIKIKYP
jgi:hypothetical protein